MMLDKNETKIKSNELISEIKKSYKYFSASVIKRTIPDIRDGLKPVQRRIIYAMHLNRFYFNTKFVKSVKVVGEVLGKFHPHGDKSVYDAIVKLAQDFTLRYPLILPQGNFGSIDGDSAADARYTEVKLSHISNTLIQAIEQQTVEFVDNFDQTEQEPVFLPSELPMLLLNGNKGIGVGVITSIPPHNLNDVIDAAILMIQTQKECSIEQLFECIKGPDFPTGGHVNSSNLLEIYKTGCGNIEMKGSIEIDEENHQLIITEIPYQIKKTVILKEIFDLRKSKILSEVTEVSDESDLSGMRVVVRCNRQFNLFNLQQKLLKKTSLQRKMYVNFLVSFKNKVLVMNLKDILSVFVDHKYEMFVRRQNFIVGQLECEYKSTSLHIWCCQNSERIVQILKNSSSKEQIYERLNELGCSSLEDQKKILDMRLYNISNMEEQRLVEKENELRTKIEFIRNILSSDALINEQIISELNESRKFDNGRKSSILSQNFTINVKTLDNFPVLIYQFQNRFLFKENIDLMQVKNIKNRSKVVSKKTGHMDQIIVSTQNSTLCLFSDDGRMIKIQPGEISDISNEGNIFEHFDLNSVLNQEFKSNSYISILPNESVDDKLVVCVTKFGNVIVRLLSRIQKTRNGTSVFKLREHDSVVRVVQANKTDRICMVSKLGKASLFNLDEIRVSKSSTFGVYGMKIDRKKDAVTNVSIVKDENDVIYIFSHLGYGKGFNSSLLISKHRNTKGVKCMKLTEGDFITSSVVANNPNHEIFILNDNSSILYTNLNSISVHNNRNTRGIRILKSDERIKHVL